MTAVPVALIGALGHGLTHRRAIHSLQDKGKVRLVAVANRRPIVSEPGAPLEEVAIFTGHRELLKDTEAELVVVCTPPHTHLRIAEDVVTSGRSLFLEKPPVVSTAEYGALASLVDRAGVACQVNFQALGSPTLARLTATAAGGTLGTPREIAVAGAWWRSDAYYRRAPWAGLRTVAGLSTGDGALSNQFAHAVMQCLALARLVTGSAVLESVELEWYRARDIEVEDTACLRVGLRGGFRILLAVTLVSAERVDGVLDLTGDRATARLEYQSDRVLLPGDADWHQLPGRVGLLENLVDHHRDRSVRLLATLTGTEPFVRLLDVLAAAPGPVRVPDSFLRPHPHGEGPTIPRIAEIVRTAAARTAMFGELGVAWARPAHCFSLVRRD